MYLKYLSEKRFFFKLKNTDIGDICCEQMKNIRLKLEMLPFY